MKHSRITIRQDNGHSTSVILTALKRANDSLNKRIKQLKIEGQPISESVACGRIKLAMIDAGFISNSMDLEIGIVNIFNGFANFIVYCDEFDIEFNVTIDMMED